MNPAFRKTVRAIKEPEPTWDIAYLFPFQGQWDEDDYLDLDQNWLLEYTDGYLEVLPMPTTSHQRLALYLYGLLLAYVTPRALGEVLTAPLRVRIRPGKYREPDILFMLKEHADRIGEKFWKGADLVMEVVGQKKKGRHRDLVTKPGDYAEAGIPEYWIVDPKEERITVLRLSGKRYSVHGEFGKGTVASSHLLKGFTVDVSEAFSRRLPRGRAKTAAKRRRR